MKVLSCDRGRGGIEEVVVDPLMHSATEYGGEVRVSKEWEGRESESEEGSCKEGTGGS